MRLTLRVRLTLIYTGLFAMCGAAIVVIAYLLVPGVLADGSRLTKQQADFLDMCSRSLSMLSAETQFKCQKAYEEGLMAGAASQRAATEVAPRSDGANTDEPRA